MIALMARLQTFTWTVRERARREDGQTSSEYLVIAGVVVGIILVILGAFRGQVTQAMQKLGQAIVNSMP